jgi:hypothetical protein
MLHGQHFFVLIHLRRDPALTHRLTLVLNRNAPREPSSTTLHRRGSPRTGGATVRRQASRPASSTQPLPDRTGLDVSTRTADQGPSITAQRRGSSSQETVNRFPDRVDAGTTNESSRGGGPAQCQSPRTLEPPGKPGFTGSDAQPR